MSLSYAIIGTGAIGGFYGGSLAHGGNDVHFLFHSDYQHVKIHGLMVDSVNGNFHLEKVNAYNHPKEMPACDVVLVCLKTTNNAVLTDILPFVTHKNSVVVFIQNGLGVEDDLAVQFPELHMAGGLAFICSQKSGPGHVEHMDFGRINLGVYGSTPVSVLQQVCADFVRSGIQAEVFSDLMLARWQKLVWNIPFNGMTVVLNTTTDKLTANESTRRLSFEMMTEVIKGAQACGVPVRDDFAEKMMEMTLKMTPYAPSMKLDYDFRRPMEIEYIYSRPVETALKAGYEMKKVAMLEQQLRFIQGGLEHA